MMAGNRLWENSEQRLGNVPNQKEEILSLLGIRSEWVTACVTHGAWVQGQPLLWAHVTTCSCPP